MTAHAELFDRWIRSAFVSMNTELENLYFSQEDRSQVIGIGDTIKHALRDEGHVHVVRCSQRETPATGSTRPSMFWAMSACIWPHCGVMN